MIVLAAFPDVISNEPIDIAAIAISTRIVRLLAQDSHLARVTTPRRCTDRSGVPSAASTNTSGAMSRR